MAWHTTTNRVCVCLCVVSYYHYINVDDDDDDDLASGTESYIDNNNND